MKTQSTVTEFEKSQLVRLFDVLILGPYLLYIVYKKTLTKTDLILLTIIAAGTIGYNLNNYIKNLKNEGI